MTPDKDMVKALHEGRVALSKVYNAVSAAHVADAPLRLSKTQENALRKLRDLSAQIVGEAQLLPLPKRRPRG